MGAQITHLIGVDGGGTGCRAALSDRTGRVLGHGKGGPANVTTDPEQAAQNVRVAVTGALAEAGLDARVLASCAAHLGLAGVLTAGQETRLAQAMRWARCTVTGDRQTALAGALGRRDGILAALGTGTLIGQRRSGHLRFVSGWGLQVSDQGSGAWLGRALLERTLLCHDGITAHSDLTLRMLAAHGGGPEGIVSFAATARPADYARLARALIEAAGAGDANARAVMKQGAGFLSGVLTALSWQPGEVLCLSGGVGPHYADWLVPAWRGRLVAPEGTPLDGALRLAREGLGDSA